ncbi:MAG: M23 family metallopeptidase [Candidatus Competibacterales bacterium]|nr:M23 family metallopeptidase [Candidatus Competibacterales bacterium]
MPVAAKQLYRYQDNQGRWHFSDRPPADNRPVETQRLTVTHASRQVSMRQRGTEREPVFHVVNEYHGPIEIELELLEGRNISADPSLPRRMVVPGVSEARVVGLSPIQDGRGMSYRLQHRYMLGDPNAVHRPPEPYRVPFPPGFELPVSQGFNGSFSHNTPAGRYAVDIAMPEGTPIVAARGGVVMEVANDFYGGGTQEQHKERANLIRVLHDDGTMAVYAHLSLESAQVSPGTRVQRGQLIGASGSTGFSSGPHLHFVIQRNAGMELVSVPFNFADGEGRGFVPRRGDWLRAGR